MKNNVGLETDLKSNHSGISFDLGIKTSIAILTGIVLLRIVIHFLLYQKGFISLTADKWGRIFNAGAWAESPDVRWSGTWLPFHRYLLGLALMIKHELVWTPRIFTIIFGLLSLVSIYWFTVQLFDNRMVGLVATFLVSLNPVHGWLSSTALTEMPSSAMIMVGILGTLIYLRKRKLPVLLLSAFALLISNGLRYESWIFSLIFSLTIIITELIGIRKGQQSPKRIIPAFLIALIPWLLPITWMAGNYIERHDALFFLNDMRSYKARYYGTVLDYSVYPKVLFSLDPIIAVTGLLAAGYTAVQWPKKTTFWYLCTTLVPFALYVFLSGGQTEPKANYIRYLGPFLFLFYPLFSYMMIKVISSFNLKSQSMLLIIIAIICITYGGYLLDITFKFQNSPSAQGFTVGQKINEIRTKNPLLKGYALVERRYWDFTAVQIGVADYRSVFFDSLVDRVSRKSVSYLTTDWQMVESCIKDKNISLLVFKDEKLQDLIVERIGAQQIAVAGEYKLYTIPEYYREIIPEPKPDYECLLTNN